MPVCMSSIDASFKISSKKLKKGTITIDWNLQSVGCDRTARLICVLWKKFHLINII